MISSILLAAGSPFNAASASLHASFRICGISFINKSVIFSDWFLNYSGF